MTATKTIRIGVDELPTEILMGDGRVSSEYVPSFVGLRGKSYDENSGGVAIVKIVAARIIEDGYAMECDVMGLVA